MTFSHCFEAFSLYFQPCTRMKQLYTDDGKQCVFDNLLNDR
jgi:hypothetical protein